MRGTVGEQTETMMTNEEYGELNALRFLVEVLMARDLARYSHQDAIGGAQALVRLSRNATVSADDPNAMEIARSTVASIERLLDRALSRASDIRGSDNTGGL